VLGEAGACTSDSWQSGVGTGLVRWALLGEELGGLNCCWEDMLGACSVNTGTIHLDLLGDHWDNNYSSGTQ
jgi:hypothetical protein